MNLNRILGIIPNIEEEIYQSQLNHLKKGIVIITPNKLPLGIDICSKFISTELQQKIPFFRLGGKKSHDYFRLQQFSPLFPDDVIKIINLKNDKYELSLISKGKSRELIEVDFSESQAKIIDNSYGNVKEYLSNLTIESFLQFNYLELFKKIKIDDPFFSKISKQNYPEMEEEFSQKIEEIIKNESFLLDFEDVFYYRRPFFFNSIKKIMQFSPDHISISNKWPKETETLVIECD